MNSGLSFLVCDLDDSRKGAIAENQAASYFLASGWEVYKSFSAASKADLIALNPQTNEKFTIQVKAVDTTSKKASIKTYTSGAGRDKGLKRKTISYYKCGIDFLIAVEITTGSYWLYEKEYFKNKQSISVKKHPGIVIPVITESEETRNKKNSKVSANLATFDQI